MFRPFIRISLLLAITAMLGYPHTLKAQQNGEVDENERLLRRNWSLFLEYFKTADYSAAKKAGWEVMKLDPTRFKTLHNKLVDLYDTLATYSEAPEQKEMYADTIIFLLDDAIKKFPTQAAEFYKQKGYQYERQYSDRKADAIAAYEAGTGSHFSDLEDMYYYERIAVLTSQIPDMKMKCISVCQAILALDANSSLAQGILRNLISDPEEYIGILRDSYYADPSSRQKLYELANSYYEMLQEYDSAIVYFNKLVALDPSVKNYWERLGASNLFLGHYSAAGKAYKKMTELDPDSKESWMNLARTVLQQGQFSEARTYAEKASDIDQAWGAPRMVVAQAYEISVQRCVERSRGGWDKMKVVDKMVYLLAQSEYARAARDPQFTDQARSRSGALNTLIPTSEDLFVNKIPKGTPYMINKDCYGWINRSVTP